MLRVASFDLSQDQKMNELLTAHRIAPNAHILVSDSKVCIPYEDGEPESVAIQIITIKENRNTCLREIAVIQHSENVTQKRLVDAKEAFQVAETKFLAKTNSKLLEKTFELSKQRYAELVNLSMVNQSEIVRKNMEIDCYNEEIAALTI